MTKEHTQTADSPTTAARLAAELSFNRDRKDNESVTDSSLTYGDLRLLAKQSSMIAEAARGIEEYSCRTSVSHIATEMSALAERLRQATHRENDGLEHCGNFSATDPITDEDRIDYWKGAYERMADRNIELCRAGKAILGHMPEFYPDNAWQHFEEMLTTGGGALP